MFCKNGDGPIWPSPLPELLWQRGTPTRAPGTILLINPASWLHYAQAGTRQALLLASLQGSFFLMCVSPILWAILYLGWAPPCSFSGDPNGKELTCQCRRYKRFGFDPWVGKIPWRKAWQPTPEFLPGESHGQRSLVGTVHGGAKSQTWLKWFSMHTPPYTIIPLVFWSHVLCN